MGHGSSAPSIKSRTLLSVPYHLDLRRRKERLDPDSLFALKGVSRRRGSQGRVLATGNEGHTGLIRATPLSEGPQ